MARWTPALLSRFLPHLISGSRYNHAYYDLDILQIARWVGEAEASTVFLGDFEGVVFFFPIAPGHGAEAHHYIWSPRFMRRPKLGRSLLKWACRKWNLRRITAEVPSHHRSLIKSVERMGFTLEGRVREGVIDYTGPSDMLLYGILASELKED